LEATRWLQVRLDEVEAAFAALGAPPPGCELPAACFEEAMTELGERMDGGELAEALRLLTGKGSVAEALPGALTPLSFAQDILGFEAAAA
jgi:hypothetical protein